jgi:uncharacterized protein YndB with AHSA1/START domain
MTRRQITIERNLQAPIEDVWELWTTKDGIESWWGPEGFAVEVRSIDLRPGGKLAYAMSARAPEMIEFMKREGMPVTNEHVLTYTEVDAPRRLAWHSLVDFVPGVEPYKAATALELVRVPDGVRLILRLDAMHDETWTERAKMGHEMELDKLARLLQARV